MLRPLTVNGYNHIDFLGRDDVTVKHVLFRRLTK